MNKEIVQKIVTDQFYPFAHFLMEDELWGMQLIVDVMTAISLENPDFFESIQREDQRRYCYKRIVGLANKRATHQSKEYEFSLSVRDKAAFYLLEREAYELQDIAIILDCELWEVSQRSLLVKGHILDKLNHKEANGFV